jgi:hypothetical protein
MSTVEKARQVGAPSGETPITLGRDALRFVRDTVVKLFPSKNVRAMLKRRWFRHRCRMGECLRGQKAQESIRLRPKLTLWVA